MRALPRHSRFAQIAAPLVLALLWATPFATAVTAQEEGEAEETGHERLLDITFPVSSEGTISYIDSFDHGRGSNRVHRATDIMAPKHSFVHAAVGGTVCHFKGDGASNINLSGYMLEICGDDGLEYSYIHLNNDDPNNPDDDDDGQGGDGWAFAPGIEKGVRVERGQWIGYVGDSGNAENAGSHLHFSIYDENQAEESGKINPFRSLLAAQDRGDVPTPPDAQAPDDQTDVADPDADAGDDQPAEDQPADDQPADDQRPADPNPVSPTPEPSSVSRVAGSTRYETAVALSQRGWPNGNARAVVLVPAGSHAEALTSAALAGHIGSPILLVDRSGLSSEVRDELRRLGPGSAYVIGSTEQIPSSVTSELDSLGIVNARIDASDRYALSARLLEELASYPDAPSIDRVILALGDAPDVSRSWPDALSASALSAHATIPVLLTESGRLPDAIADALTSSRPDEILVIGGTAAITGQVADEAAAAAGGARVTRLSGDSRYDTSVAVAQAGRDAGLNSGTVLVATGLNYPDALAAGPVATRLRAPLVLVHGTSLNGSPGSIRWIADLGLEPTVVGGPAVVTDEVASALTR